MGKIICEICGIGDLVKNESVFVCENCGAKYSVEEVKRMISENNYEASGIVKIDNSDKIKNLYMIARRAKKDNNAENAAKYYEMILIEEPMSWEAYFYIVYFKAMVCKIAQIQSASISLSNCIGTTLMMIKDSGLEKKEQEKAVLDIDIGCTFISGILYNGALSHFNGINTQIRINYLQELVENCIATRDIMYTLGNEIDLKFNDNTVLCNIAACAWKNGINKHSDMMRYLSLSQKNINKSVIASYAEKVRKYEPSYNEPILNKDGGCYIATAVYGSYDCPQVWTLRRYRDFILSKRVWGRNFIKLYYMLSPIILSYFGNKKWFTQFWRMVLDYKIKQLNKRGIDDTKYDDKQW